MDIKNVFKLSVFPVIIIGVTLVLNEDKFQLSAAKAIAHVSLQAIFIYGLILTFRKIRFARLGIALFVAIELFMQLSYDASLSYGVVMSLLSTSLSETVSFIELNVISILLSLFFIIAVVFLKLPSNRLTSRVGMSCLLIGAIYVITPTIMSIKPLLSSKSYEGFYRAGIAKGQSEYTTIGEVLIRNTSGRFPPLISIIAISDAFHFSLFQGNTQSTWTNVTIEDASPELLIIGIGESLRADNMGIYGYERNTTPKLSSIEKSLTIVNHAYSAGTNTWSSIPAAMTKYSSAQDVSKSIINLAKDAGYKTYWLSNHGKSTTWDFSVSAIAQQADYTYFTSIEQGGTSYDEVLLAKLEEVLVSSAHEKRRLIILHNYGSHTKFKDRYPAEFSEFKGSDARLNQYDNSILYTDHLQFQTLRLVSKHHGKYLFFADHGLVNPQKKLRFKHDVRDNPDLDSIKVPFFLSHDSGLFVNNDNPVSLFYFECIFSKWSGILSAELTENNYCNDALKKKTITFIDAYQKRHDKIIDIASLGEEG